MPPRPGWAVAGGRVVHAMIEHPNPPAQAQKKGWGCGKAFLFVVALLVMVVVVAVAVDRLTYEPPTSDQIEQQAKRQAERERAQAVSTAQHEARVLCRYAVEAKLRAPSTAEWEKLPKVENRGAGRYEVNGWVDAENAFGAKLRNDYRCVVAGRRVEEVEILAR